jgi:hypothetical protein
MRRRHRSGTSIDFEVASPNKAAVNVREGLCEAASSLLLRARKWFALRV